MMFRFNRICITLWIAAAAVLFFLAFDHAMQADAKRMCRNPATATDAVCAQAGMRRL